LGGSQISEVGGWGRKEEVKGRDFVDILDGVWYIDLVGPCSGVCQFVEDEWLDDKDVKKIRRLYQCLPKLGWVLGE
jgi:hypothetical protein